MIQIRDYLYNIAYMEACIVLWYKSGTIEVPMKEISAISISAVVPCQRQGCYHL